MLQVLRKVLNLLSANYSHFKPTFEEAKNIAKVFSIYFENNVLKNDTRELATNMTTACNFSQLISRLCGKCVNHTCNSQKQLSAHELSLSEIKVFQKLFLKVCNVFYGFSCVKTSCRYFMCYFKQHWFANWIIYIYQ